MIWDLDPNLIAGEGDLPGIRYYAVAVSLGMICAILATSHYGDRGGIPPRSMTWMLVLSAIAALLGGHFGHLAAYEPDGLTDLARLISLGSGLASHGAVAAVLLVVFVYARVRGEDPWLGWDAVISGGAFLFPFWRLGNLANSEIVGRAWDGPWAMRFPRHDCIFFASQTQICAEAVPRHPTQIYEALFGLIMIAIVIYAQRSWTSRLRPGSLSLFVLATYFMGRFEIEFMVEYQILDPSTSDLTMGQWLSLPFILVSISFFLARRAWRDVKAE